MKKIALTVLTFALFNLFFVTTIQAQEPANGIETLILDIWPDYDEPSVLILMTGTLPQDTTLPAAITIPMPPDAEVNAVARINDNNQMIDDITYTLAGNELTFVTPDPRFRLEYYAPYESDGINHAFSFDWLADISVESLLAAIQQPTGATNMNVTPSANIVPDSSDGFTYYTFPPQTIPAGEQFTITFDYDMAVPQLSIDNRPVVNSAADTSTGGSTTNNASSAASNSFSLQDNSWIWILGLIGAVLLAVVITWQVATRNSQPARKNRKPRPKRAASAAKPVGKVRFCHECGNKLSAKDKFCRECGTAVK